MSFAKTINLQRSFPPDGHKRGVVFCSVKVTHKEKTISKKTKTTFTQNISINPIGLEAGGEGQHIAQLWYASLRSVDDNVTPAL